VKVGDLVKLSSFASGRPSFRAGLIIELVEKKCWRTDIHGKKIDWSKVEPEPHAVVLIRGDTRTIPVTDLQSIDEG